MLDELPEKIEDIRTCTLSDEQRELYRETIATRGAALADRIRSKSEPLPYIHIFAVLNLLKQICDHPGARARQARLAGRSTSRASGSCSSELLDESLDSGQKVVVFTQYLGMIGIMERHLREPGRRVRDPHRRDRASAARWSTASTRTRAAASSSAA